MPLLQEEGRGGAQLQRPGQEAEGGALVRGQGEKGVKGVQEEPEVNGLEVLEEKGHKVKEELR